MISIRTILRTHFTKNLLQLLLLLYYCMFTMITYGQTNSKGIINKNVASTDSSSSPRQIIPFDDNWRFFPGDNATAKDVAFDDSQWHTLNLPHDWSIEGPVNPPPSGDRNTGYFTHGIGWYRKSFVTPDTSKKVVVEFDGIYMNSDVWINGNFLGHRPYGFININYDLTEYLNKDGKPNVLAVRVDDAAEPA